MPSRADIIFFDDGFKGHSLLYNVLSRMVNFIMKYGEKAIKKARLEIWENPNPERDYEINITLPEFTCLCPRSGYPDFATFVVRYVPDQKIVESKSFKLYLWSYREEGTFHEHVINKMLDDLVEALDPHWIKVVGEFNVRGGIGIKVEAEHTKTPAAKRLWDKS